MGQIDDYFIKLRIFEACLKSKRSSQKDHW
jgi:hypothetical protein